MKFQNILDPNANFTGWVYGILQSVSMQKSQRYHFDHGEPKTLVKVFILLSDVNEENGPFSFFDAKTSKSYI